MRHMLFQTFFIVWLILISFSMLNFVFQNQGMHAFLRLLRVFLAVFTLCVGLVGLFSSRPITIAVPNLFLNASIHFCLQPLSSFFLMIMGLCDIAVSIFSLDYYQSEKLLTQIKILFFEALFVFSIILVFTSHHPISFLFSWEMMTLTSYFLVAGIHSNKQTRKAGLLYFSIAHIAFFAIVASFYLLFSHVDAALTQIMANWIFIFAFIGFGAKAGLFPLHIWLPEAHPAAPSPISALMSGVMLNTAVYALLQFCFIFLSSHLESAWGYTCIMIGLITMLIGVIHAALEIDMKRLLAYSSMENMGLIFAAMGLAIIFKKHQHDVLFHLALLVICLHALNHSIFKSLLFLGTGSILKRTNETHFKKLGGLIHAMPFVSIVMLIGTFSMAGLPFFNGFVSEWLYLSIFFHPASHQAFLFSIVSPVIIGTSGLVFGMLGLVTIKFFAFTFLGQPRTQVNFFLTKITWPEKISLAGLSAGCLWLGLWPQKIIGIINQLWEKQTTELSAQINALHGFDPLYLLFIFLFLFLIIFIFLKYYSPSVVRRNLAWNGGFDSIGSRMQDSPEGFSQPFRQIFENFIAARYHASTQQNSSPHYHEHTHEKIWNIFYAPLIQLALRLAKLTKWFQQGNISTYLLYMSITLFLLLIWVIGL